MTREAFIRKWLCTEKPYTEPFRDEMREDLDKVLAHLNTANNTGLEDNLDVKVIEQPDNQEGLSNKKDRLYTAKDMKAFAEWLIGRSADWITDEERCETAETFIEMWEKERGVNTSKPQNSKQQCPTCGSDSLITLSDITYCMNDCCDGVKGHNVRRYVGLPVQKPTKVNASK